MSTCSSRALQNKGIKLVYHPSSAQVKDSISKTFQHHSGRMQLHILGTFGPSCETWRSLMPIRNTPHRGTFYRHVTADNPRNELRHRYGHHPSEHQMHEADSRTSKRWLICGPEWERCCHENTHNQSRYRGSQCLSEAGKKKSCNSTKCGHYTIPLWLARAPSACSRLSLLAVGAAGWEGWLIAAVPHQRGALLSPGPSKQPALISLQSTA